MQPQWVLLFLPFLALTERKATFFKFCLPKTKKQPKVSKVSNERKEKNVGTRGSLLLPPIIKL